MHNRQRPLRRSGWISLACLAVFCLPAAAAQSLRAPMFRGERIDYELPYQVQTPAGVTTTILLPQKALGGRFHAPDHNDLLVANDPCSGGGQVALVHLAETGGIDSISVTAVSSSCSNRIARNPGDSLTFGDFDLDGRMDVAFWGARQLYRLTAGGAFTASPIDLPLDPTGDDFSPTYQVSGDLNGDGSPDVVVVQPFFIIDFTTFDFFVGSHLYVFVSDRHGGFVRSQKIEAPHDPLQYFSVVPLELSDFTGDSKADLLVEGSGPLGSSEILTGDGAGHLSLPQDGLRFSPILPSPYGTGSDLPGSSGDLNGDHLPDLVLDFTVNGSMLSGTVLLSRAPGQYESRQITAPLLRSYPGAFRSSIADINGDGLQDLEVFGYGVLVDILQRPDGAFHALPERFPPLDVQGMLRLRWDEDRFDDRIAYGYPSGYVDAHSIATLSVFPGHSSTAVDSVDLDLSSGSPGFGSPAVAHGDFNGDRHQDLVSVDRNGITLFLGNGRGGFSRVPAWSSSGQYLFSRVDTGDWNRDSRTDLVVLRGNAADVEGPGSFAMYLSQAPPGPLLALSASMPVGPRPNKAVAADLNGDGKLDLVVSSLGVKLNYFRELVNGSAVTFLGDGAGGFAPSAPAYVLPSPLIDPQVLDIEAGNVDTDDVPDLIVLYSYGFDSNAFGAWGKGHGDGTFELPDYFGSTWMSFGERLLRPRDLNGDGLTDLFLSPLLGYPGDTAASYLGTPGATTRFLVPSGCCNYAGAFVDMDGDGLVDLVGKGVLDSLRFGSGAGTGEFLRSGPDYSPSGSFFSSERPGIPVLLQTDFDEDGRVDVATLDAANHLTVMFNRANRLASDPPESLAAGFSGPHAVSPEIDMVEVQGRLGAYDFSGSGTPQGALVFTLSLNQLQPEDSEAGEVGRGLIDREDGSESARPGSGPGRLHPLSAPSPGRPPVAMKSGLFQLFMNFGEPLKDSDGDKVADLSLANAADEPGLSGASPADVTLNLNLDSGGPAFTGLHGINRFSTVDRARGIATFVVPYDQLLAALTPVERAAMNLGNGTGRLFLWAVSRLYSDRDRMPDTNDDGEPTVRSEVRAFRFPLTDLHVTPLLQFNNVRIGKSLLGPLTVTNRGVESAAFGSATIPDPAISVLPGLPFTVGPLQQFQASARFAPTTHITLHGPLSLNSPAGALSALLYGKGVAPILRVSPLSVDFGATPVGFFSASRAIEVQNVGDDLLEGTWELRNAPNQFGFGGDYGGFYSPEGIYPLELSPNETSRSYLSFGPAREGPDSAYVHITSDDALLPQVDVQLTAMATPPEARVSIDGNPPRLWDVPLNGEGSGDLTLVNDGSAPLLISSVTSSNPHFTIRLQAAEIAPRERRPLTVTYHPVTWGPETTRLTIFHNDPSQGPVTVFVEGRAYEPPPVLQVSPTVLDFGDLHRGDSATLAFDIRNAGAGPLFLYGDNPLLYSSCRAQTDLVLPLTLLPNESRTAHVTYTADLSKVLCYSFSFYSNDPSNHSVTISMPATILTPRIALDYNFLEFPYTAVGRTSTAAMRVRNVGSDTLVISSASIVYDYDPVFALATFLPLSIPAGGFADLQLLYSPLSDRNSGGMVTLESNDPYLPTVSFQILGFGYLPESIPLHTREPFR